MEKNNNIFIEVGRYYLDNLIPIISDGKSFYTLELCKNGIYTDCLKVSNKDGLFDDNTSHTEVFEPVYEIKDNTEILIGYRML